VKLAGDRAAAFARAPDRRVTAILLHGPDAAQVALHRADLVAALSGGDAMRLTRIEPDALRRDPAGLWDALRARGFFPGRRAVLIDGAKDGLAETVAAACEGLTPEDAVLVVAAPGIAAKSKLVRAFEAPGRAVLAFYPEQTEDPAALLARAGCRARPTAEAEAALAAIGADLDAGSLRRFCETLALYAGDAERLEAEDVAALAPARPGAAEALVGAVAAGQAERVVALIARLAASGTSAQAMLGAVGRHMRLIHRLLADPAGPRHAIEGLRPPVFGPRRDRLAREAAAWSLPRAERAVTLLHGAERALRAAGPARPARALAERCLMRVAMMAGRGG